MINYGAVYPQAILVFVITMLYSVIQPLIMVFGAAYFGISYVVYKYKLLFGELSSASTTRVTLTTNSVLQAVREPRSGMAHHIRANDVGRRNLPGALGSVSLDF